MGKTWLNMSENLIAIKDILLTTNKEYTEIIFKIIKHIIQNPTDTKFRKLKKSNKKLAPLLQDDNLILIFIMIGFEDEVIDSEEI